MHIYFGEVKDGKITRINRRHIGDEYGSRLFFSPSHNLMMLRRAGSSSFDIFDCSHSSFFEDKEEISSSDKRRFGPTIEDVPYVNGPEEVQIFFDESDTYLCCLT